MTGIGELLRTATRAHNTDPEYQEAIETSGREYQERIDVVDHGGVMYVFGSRSSNWTSRVVATKGRR